MTEFTKDVRRYCRNPRCRSKLPLPAFNSREAFCARGCHTAFYRRRCLVCERPIERSRDDQKICRKAKCRSAWRARTGFGRYRGKMARSVENPQVLTRRRECPCQFPTRLDTGRSKCVEI